MPLNLAPVNLAAGVTQNPLAQIGAALAALPAQQQQAQLQNQVIGKQMMQPYLNMIKANKDYEQDPSVMGPLNAISKRYGIPIPYDSPDAPDATPGAGTTQSTGQATPQTPPASTPGGPQTPPGPGAAMSIGGPASAPSGGVATPPVPGVVPGAQPTPGSPAFQPPQQAQQQPQAQPAPPQSLVNPSGQQPSSAPEPRHIAASFVGATLDPATVLALQGMPPAQRKTYLQSIGVDPKWAPKSLLSEAPVLSPELRERVTTDIEHQLDVLSGSGGLTPDAFQRIITLKKNEGLLDDAGAEGLLHDQGYLSQIGRGLELKLQLAAQGNYWKGMNYSVEAGRLQQMIKNGASLDQLRTWQEKVLGSAKIGLMSVQEQGILGNLQERTNHDSAQAQYWGGLLQQGGTRLGLQQYGQLTTDLRSARTNLAGLIQQASRVRAAGGDPTSSLTTGNDPQGNAIPGQSLAQDIVNQEGTVSALGDLVTQANGNYRNVDNALHKQGVQTGNGKPPAGWKASMQLNGKPIGQVGKDGPWYYADGTVAQ